MGSGRGLTIGAQEPESGLAPRQCLFLGVLSQLHSGLTSHRHQLQRQVLGPWESPPKPMTPLAHSTGPQTLS